jgi:hypothetical protein
MPRKRFQARLTRSGRPDGRTKEGKAFYRRSEAARRGWETRRERQREAQIGWEPAERWETIVEEPIETVGGRRYGKKK